MGRLSRDQQRRKKLTERQRRKQRQQSARPKLHQERVAEVVHQTVCEYTGTDGVGLCVWYAMAGTGLLWELTKDMRITPQAGALFLQLDPADPGAFLTMDPDNGPGEIHAWIVWPTKKLAPGQRGVDDRLTFIDFSARHYRRYIEDMAMIHVPGVEPVAREWRQPEPPPTYLWGKKDELPPWVQFSPRATATTDLFRQLRDFDRVIKLAIRRYKESE